MATDKLQTINSSQDVFMAPAYPYRAQVWRLIYNFFFGVNGKCFLRLLNFAGGFFFFFYWIIIFLETHCTKHRRHNAAPWNITQSLKISVNPMWALVALRCSRSFVGPCFISRTVWMVHIVEMTKCYDMPWNNFSSTCINSTCVVVLELDRWNVIRVLFSSLDIVKTSAIYLLALDVPEQMKKALDLTLKKKSAS